MLPVVELDLDPAADLNPAVSGDRHVSPVKEGMEIATEKQAVAYDVLAPLRVRANMCGLKDWQDFLSSEGTLSVVNRGWGSYRVTSAWNERTLSSTSRSSLAS